MKPRLVVLILSVAALAGGVGWFAAKHWSAQPVESSPGGRKVRFYQSAMHPWIRSDRPGKCTICGMDLVPVYEGDKGFDVGEGLVTLSSNSMAVIHVQTDEVRRQAMRHTLRVAGTIDDDDTRHRFLPAYVEGRIEKLFVNYVGAEIVEGQAIASIYSPALVNSEREYILLAAQTPDSAESREQHARSIEAIVRRLKSVGLTEAQIAALPGKPPGDWHTEILAPMSGIVVARHVYEGQYVKEGDKLFEIGDFSTMWFKFDAYERDLPWLRVGQEVEVTTPAVPGKVYSAKITFIDPNLNEQTRSAKVRVDIPNPIVEQDGRARRELYRRLYAEAVVKADLPEVLAVPRSAVLAPGTQPVVYVDKGRGAYEQRRVRLGRVGDALWEALEGVSEGERVVTVGNLLIDAQAQLNQSAYGAGTSRTPFHGSISKSASVAESAAGQSMSEAQQKLVKDFLAAADALRAALSGDDLAGFNQQAAALQVQLPALLNAFKDTPAWQPLIARVEATGHLETAIDLKAARKEFFAFSSAVVEFAQRLRAHRSEFGSLKVYLCPMLKQAFPGAPSKGLWLQLEGPLRNPWFGAEMMDCGTEIK